MRYFRYKHTGRVYNDAWKAEFVKLTKDEQKNVRRNKVLDKVGATVLLCVMFACLIGCGIAINQIPKPERGLLLVLYYFVKVLLWIVSFVFSGFVGYIVASPILKKSRIHHMPLGDRHCMKLVHRCESFMGCRSLTFSQNALNAVTRNSTTMMFVSLSMKTSCGSRQIC